MGEFGDSSSAGQEQLQVSGRGLRAAVDLSRLLLMMMIPKITPWGFILQLQVMVRCRGIIRDDTLVKICIVLQALQLSM